MTAMPTDPGDIATGATITETYLDRIRAFALWAGTGSTSSPASWTAFSATLTQSGSVSMSTNSCAYARFGELVVCYGKLVASAAGTSVNPIVVGGLPVTAASADTLCGFAMFQDASVVALSQNFPGNAYLATTTSFVIYSGNGQPVGADHSVTTEAIASGDALWFALLYRCA